MKSELENTLQKPAILALIWQILTVGGHRTSCQGPCPGFRYRIGSLRPSYHRVGGLVGGRQAGQVSLVYTTANQRGRGNLSRASSLSVTGGKKTFRNCFLCSRIGSGLSIVPNGRATQLSCRRASSGCDPMSPIAPLVRTYMQGPMLTLSKRLLSVWLDALQDAIDQTQRSE
jgi:hypothetical protein